MKPGRKPLAAQYWFAPACLMLGTANLCRAAYFYFLHNSLSLGMFAAGGALLIIGLFATYYAWDDYQDERKKLLPPQDEEELTAEEYARRFEEERH